MPIHEIETGNRDDNVFVIRVRDDEPHATGSFTFRDGTLVLRIGQDGYGCRYSVIEPGEAMELAGALLRATLEQ